jgi:enamine deaminase RidA (YjgF/YER057c/UK114 family)
MAQSLQFDQPRITRLQGVIMNVGVTHLNPSGMHNNPAFSQGVAVEGGARTIYVGGQNAVAADGEIVGTGDLAAQTEQVFVNLRTVLASAGAELHDVIKWTIYVVQGQDLLPGLGVFQKNWGTAPPPAISVLFVAGLAHPDFMVEIEAVAVTGTTVGGS